MPKLAVSIPITEDGQWHGGLFGANDVPAIVKPERDSHPGLLTLKELSYRYHREAGFPVPKTWLKTLEHHGDHGKAVALLAVQRFDRKAGVPVPLESFFSLLKTGSPAKFIGNTDGAMEDAAKVFTVLNLPAALRDDWYRRFVMSFLTGNGDLHLEKTAILGGASACGLSPVFDPAAMRAYRGGRNNHDLLSALPFAGVGGDERPGGYLPYSASGQTPANLGHLLVAFGKPIGIDPRRSRGYIADLLEKTAGFREEALAVLESMPEARRRYRAPDVDEFAKTLDEVRQAIAATFAKLGRTM